MDAPGTQAQGPSSSFTAAEMERLVDAHGSLSIAFAEVLVGPGEAEATAEQAWLTFFVTQSGHEPSRIITEILLEVRQEAERRGHRVDLKSVRWLREVSGLSTAVCATVLGSTRAECDHAIDQALMERSGPVAPACRDAVQRMHALMVDGPLQPADHIAKAHIGTCAACEDRQRQLASERMTLPMRPFRMPRARFESAALASVRRDGRARLTRVALWLIGPLIVLAFFLFRGAGSSEEPMPLMKGNELQSRWWKIEAGVPLMSGLQKLVGSKSQPPIPTFSVIMGPKGEYLMKIDGWAIVPSEKDAAPQLVQLPRGDVGKIGFDGTTSWYERGDGVVHPIDSTAAKRAERTAFGMLELVQSVMKEVEKGFEENTEFEPVEIQKEMMRECQIPLPNAGPKFGGLTAKVAIDSKGLPRRVSVSPFLMKLDPLEPKAGENPCAADIAVRPAATSRKGG